MKSVMVVDDEPAQRAVVARLLTGEGYHVTQAENGRVAMAMIRAGLLPDLILLDLRMPEMDGVEFVTEIKKWKPWADIPIIVTSALEMADPPAPWFVQIDKPFRGEELIEAVRRYVK